jgi:hypothetical protein
VGCTHAVLSNHDQIVSLPFHGDAMAALASKRTIRQSYIDLRGINLGAEFIRDNKLTPSQRYPMKVEGLVDEEPEGTLDKSGFIGGLAVMYKAYELKDGDEVEVLFQDSILLIKPPVEKLRQVVQTAPVAGSQQPVFKRQSLTHIHIEPFAFGNLSRWIPQTEADVYMVFGILSEYTDYRYCCGASKHLLTKLAYTSETKPDAILIDRTTDEYLMAEFKVSSKDFTINHSKDDVDVLVCWDHNETDLDKLPPRVLGLRSKLEQALKDGELTL